MRQKMKNFRTSYTKANDWRKSTGAGLDENDENTIAEKLNKMCPYWNYLEEIFSAKTSVNPVAIYETGKGVKGEMNELIIDDDIEISFDLDNGSNNSLQSIEGMDLDVLDMDVDHSTASGSTQNKTDDNVSQLFSLAKRMQTKPASRPNVNNSSALLLQITEKRNEIQEKKLALEERKLALEEKRIDQEFEIKKMELEARKMEAETARLQIMQRNNDQN